MLWVGSVAMIRRCRSARSLLRFEREDESLAALRHAPPVPRSSRANSSSAAAGRSAACEARADRLAVSAPAFVGSPCAGSSRRSSLPTQRTTAFELALPDGCRRRAADAVTFRDGDGAEVLRRGTAQNLAQMTRGGARERDHSRARHETRQRRCRPVVQTLGTTRVEVACRKCRAAARWSSPRTTLSPSYATGPVDDASLST
jgi:hypothetical protein